MIKDLFEELISSLNRRSLKRAVATLDDHLLRDIGIDPRTRESPRLLGSKSKNESDRSDA